MSQWAAGSVLMRWWWALGWLQYMDEFWFQRALVDQCSCCFVVSRPTVTRTYYRHSRDGKELKIVDTGSVLLSRVVGNL